MGVEEDGVAPPDPLAVFADPAPMVAGEVAAEVVKSAWVLEVEAVKAPCSKVRWSWASPGMRNAQIDFRANTQLIKLTTFQTGCSAPNSEPPTIRSVYLQHY